MRKKVGISLEILWDGAKSRLDRCRELRLCKDDQVKIGGRHDEATSESDVTSVVPDPEGHLPCN